MKGFVFAVSAGVCAALASVFGKLLMSSPPLVLLTLFDGLFTPVQIEWIMRALFLALLLTSNMLMFNLFVKSLALASSLFATITNTASNFFCSALLGALFFQEPLPLLWWFGASLIISGLFLLLQSEENKTKQE